jgi:hypothetical protein
VRSPGSGVADFLAADNGATRAEAITAWNELKELDVPKDYVSWVKASLRSRTTSVIGTALNAVAAPPWWAATPQR